MNTSTNRSLAGVPPISAVRDIVRIVVAAALAGAGFAVLLALAVLSLTVIAPPAGASGAPAAVSAQPDALAGATPAQPADTPRSGLVAEAAAAPAASAAPAPAAATAVGTEPALDVPKLAALALLLALLAGAAVWFVRGRSRS